MANYGQVNQEVKQKKMLKYRTCTYIFMYGHVLAIRKCF